MGRMYSVFVHSSGKVVAVPEGFSFAAFIFGGLWAIANGFVIRGLALLAAIVTSNVLFEVAQEAKQGYAWVFALTSLGITFFVGVSANKWLANKLRKQGYVDQGLVEASSELEAKKSRPEFQSAINQEWRRPF